MPRPTRPCERFPHVCPVCGNEFLGRKSRQYCSHRCAMANIAHEAGKKGAAATIGARRVAALAAKSEKARRREFFAKLDAEYERNFPGLQSGDVRGRIAAGGRSSTFRACDQGAIVRRFIAPTSEQ